MRKIKKATEKLLAPLKGMGNEAGPPCNILIKEITNFSRYLRFPVNDTTFYLGD